MGTFSERFGEELTKLAQIVETIDNSFLKNGDVEINVKLNDRDYLNLVQNLGNNIEDKKCIISIENINFIFLRR